MGVVRQFEDEAPKELYDAPPKEIEEAFMKFCETKKGKEERFVRMYFFHIVPGPTEPGYAHTV